MRLTKTERENSMHMMAGWCMHYGQMLAIHRDLCEEFYAVTRYAKVSTGIAGSVIRIEEMIRDICILRRTQELALSKFTMGRGTAKVDSIISRFFKTRKEFEIKWAGIDQRAGEILFFLRSAPLEP